MEESTLRWPTDNDDVNSTATTLLLLILIGCYSNSFYRPLKGSKICSRIKSVDFFLNESRKLYSFSNFTEPDNGKLHY